jgi:hypothetical protein
MAKRTRYPKRTSSRPAQRPSRTGAGGTAAAREPIVPKVEPIDFSGSDDSVDDTPMDLPLRSSSGLTEAEVERAEQLEAEATARERAAIADSLRRQAARNATAERAQPRGDVNAPLSVRMAHEYGYVARDVRRILLTGGLMVAILAALAILINVVGVIKL